MSAVAALLPDGRLHLQHGPIDCLCRSWGEAPEVRAAYGQAAGFFGSVLDGLCAELPLLRTPLPARRAEGAVARAMQVACLPLADRFITPMAAVAGAVADAVLAAMVRGRWLSKAFVNNGGDIAFYLAPGESLRCGLVADLTLAESSWPGLSGRASTRVRAPIPARAAIGGPDKPGHDEEDTAPRTQPLPPSSLDGTFLLTSGHPARGLATSGRACKGRGGRSFSFGIADSVSILARSAAEADAAATIVCNAVDLPGHPAIDRRPASAIDPASDLGDRLVTYEIGPLTDAEIEIALDAGGSMADTLLRAGLIEGAVLTLCGQTRIHHPILIPQEAA